MSTVHCDLGILSVDSIQLESCSTARQQAELHQSMRLTEMEMHFKRKQLEIETKDGEKREH